MTHEPTHLDLFSGVAGFALAAQWAGFRTVAFSEIDPYCCRLLAKRFPDVPNLGDIRCADVSPYVGRVDLLTAGVPCQPASVAGKRLGKSDDRWLWPAALAVLGAVRPTFAVLENPCGILALESGVVFEQLLSAMEAHGYSVQPIGIPACAVDAWHPRKRIWIVAHLAGDRRQTRQVSVRSRGQERAATDAHGLGANGAVADAVGQFSAQAAPGQKLPWGNKAGDGRWPEFDPGLLRVVHGLSNRLDRIGALGNAIVPQVAFQILKAIREQLTS